MRTEEALVEEAWAAVAGDAARPDVAVSGARDILPSTLPTGAAATAAVMTALAAAAALTNGRAAFATDRGHISDAVGSERLVRTDGQSIGATFAPLSRFWRTADGFIRTHANYPWHRDALLRALDLSTEARVEAVASEIGQRVAIDIEERVFAEGGSAARVREEREWQQHPQGAAVCAEPLVGHAIVGPAGSRMRSHVGMPDGIRVLDLTRVIAGPVCTRFLGALGADVLRIDPPHHHDIPPGMYADTLLGKRSAVLDLTRYTDRLHALLDDADVLVCGYRPGALDRFGLTDDDLAERHPGLVVVRLAAWGHSGPWRHRRGFDSVVQAGVGIADIEADGRHPGALPCQLLDHGTGYLAAAAVLDGLYRQAAEGGTVVRRLSLARTAAWLLAAPRDPAAVPAPVAAAGEDWTVRVGPVTAVAPPGSVDGHPLRWPEPPARFLADDPIWS